MSANPTPRASDLAAQQVEQIVTAAQAAAEEIRTEARLESEEISAAALREGQDLIQKARRDSEEELREARKQAIILGKGARRDSQALVDDAHHDATQIREKARRSVEGRVVAAERAAAEVLEEARALSGGLRQLGKALEDHAERILRDVTAAHKRMQSDLRVGIPGDDGPIRVARNEDGAASGGSRSSRSAEASSGRRDSQPATDGEPSQPKGRNPFEEIELPSWVGRDR